MTSSQSMTSDEATTSDEAMTSDEERTWVPAGSVDDPTPRRVEGPHGVAALVSVHDGVPFAVADRCLHKGASLAGGVVHGTVITCPSHWWRYDLCTGVRQGQPDQALATFPCRVNDDGTVDVGLPSTPAPSLRETLLAHARSSA